MFGLLVVPGPEAPDDGEIAESHVEPGKYLKIPPVVLDDPLLGGEKKKNPSFHNFFPGTTEAQGRRERQSRRRLQLEVQRMQRRPPSV